jgi:DNA-binding MarR family transcriptional regulator
VTDRTDDLADLLRHASRALRRQTFAVVEPYGLSVHQFRALRLIAGKADAGRRDGDEPLRISDVAEQMRIVTRSATDVIDHLETKGFVRRSAHPTDRRSTVVEVTEHGADVLKRVEVLRVGQAKKFFAPLSAAQQDELARLLRTLDGQG